MEKPKTTSGKGKPSTSAGNSSSSGTAKPPVVLKIFNKRSVGSAAPLSQKKLKKDSDLSVKEELECIVCLDFAPSPIQVCTNGHITCGICTDKLPRKQCSICKGKLSISKFGERMAKKLEVTLPCQNQEEGCETVIKSTELKKHHTICQYRPLLCDQGDCEDEPVSFSEYAAHMAQTHKLDIVSGSKHSTEFLIWTKLPRGKWKEFEIEVIRYRDGVFRWKAYQTQSTVYSWVEFLGDKEEAEEFWFTMQVGKPKPSRKGLVKFQFPVFPVHSVATKKPASPRFAAFPISQLKTLSPGEWRDGIVSRFYLELD